MTLSFTYKRQMMQKAKPSVRLNRAMKHLLPSFEPVYEHHKKPFIASTIPHLLYEGCGVSLNIKWIIFMFDIYPSGRTKN